MLNRKQFNTFWRLERQAYDLCPTWEMCHSKEPKLVNRDKDLIECRRRNPIPGYLGKDYGGVLVIAQNSNTTPPGKREHDTEMFNQLDLASKMRVDGWANRASQILSQEVPTWGPLSQMQFDRWGIAIEEIAYLNLIKCTSRNPETGRGSGSSPNTFVRDQCATSYLVPQIRLLKPQLIVFRYKGVEPALRRAIQQLGQADESLPELNEWLTTVPVIVIFKDLKVSHEQLEDNLPIIQETIRQLNKAY